MKKVDNRQKQQVQARAQRAPHSHGPKGKESVDPHASGAVSKESVEGTGTPLTPIHREGPKIGRNDLCPCGSGKKYKKCCLAKLEK